MAIHIENARPEDKPAVIALLRQGQLLTDDLPTDLSDFLIAKEQNKVVGVAGIERFGAIGLLRSVAVDPDFQGRQIGSQLIGRLLDTASARELADVYLITTTAEQYFGRHGFLPVDRLDAPLAIQATSQFSGLCPASAVVMKRML
ncbi:arsenic resistance N-acetyltransferase ArsN2 [Spirosoma sp. SC4-14]|uniref:arsenic resistance N-acetyltransferase ArsN2 n=1 Tax=Spirosoma sp. SC4-14 TaxID=3128900 RepID=UPI0030CC7AB8